MTHLAPSRAKPCSSRALRVTAASRPFGGGGSPPQDGARPQAPTAVASLVPTVEDASPPVAEQQQNLSKLLQRLSQAATYSDKVRGQLGGGQTAQHDA